MQGKNSIIRIDNETFKKFQTYVRQKIGINLPAAKKGLVESRFSNYIMKAGFKSFQEYLDYLVNDRSNSEYDFFVDRITTHTTHFFREKGHFDFLIKKGTTLINTFFNSPPMIKVLSIGTSTGEELYSLAIVLTEQQKSGFIHDFTIHGADVSRKALEKAKKGIFNSKNLEYIPTQYKKYFTIQKNQTIIEAKPVLKKNLKFFMLNACKKNQNFPDNYHIIFCRNMLIYFSKPLQQNVISNILRILLKNGLLFTGSTESLYTLSHNLKKIETTIYQGV
jgi:chemotaxis protein methyltransferase CheR